MKKLLEQIHNYLRRKLGELQPEHISIVVFVPRDIHHDLVDEYPSELIGDKPIVSFVNGEWPDEAVLNFTPIPPAEEIK